MAHPTQQKETPSLNIEVGRPDGHGKDRCRRSERKEGSFKKRQRGTSPQAASRHSSLMCRVSFEIAVHHSPTPTIDRDFSNLGLRNHILGSANFRSISAARERFRQPTC